MTPVNLATLVRFYTKTDATTLPNATLLLLANNAKNEIAAEIVKCNEDYFLQRFYRDLEAGIREYAIDDAILNQIKYVEAKLDGTNQLHLDEFDLNTYRRPTDETDIRNYFTSLRPMYDITRRALVIYSGDAIIDVDDGLILYAPQYPADITDLTSVVDMVTDPSTTSFGIPTPFHELIARRASIMWKSAQEKPIPLSDLEKAYPNDLQLALNSIKGMNTDRVLEASTPYDDGSQY